MSDSERTAGQWWTTGGEHVSLPLSQVRELALSLLQRCGASAADAAFIADVHLAKALQGDHERGVGMLVDQIRAAQSGAMDFALRPRVVRERGATAVVAAPRGACAKLVCRDAMALAIDKARQHGVGCVSASAQVEMLTPHVEQAVQAGLVGLVFGQSFAAVAPHGGTAPLLGNAPIGWGIPAGRHAPVIVDMSLTQTSAKGVVRAALDGLRVPPGFLLDAQGEPTTEPKDFIDPRSRAGGPRGSLLPLGASHKGYALVFVIGLLSAILSDGGFAWELDDADPVAPRGYGSVFLALDPACFGDPHELLARVDAYIEHLQGSPRRDGTQRILYPGERSQELKRERTAEDRLSLPRAHHEALLALRPPAA